MQAHQKNVDPRNLLNQVISGYTDEQKEEFFKQAKMHGIPEDVINKVK